jgi:hypothetical protein
MSFLCFSPQRVIISLNSFNQLILVMLKCGVLFEVRTEFLSIIKTIVGFKQSFTIHHSNVFALILLLSEGRVGITWVPSNKMLFLSPLPDIKRLYYP